MSDRVPTSSVANRITNAVAEVRHRLERVSAALGAAKVPYRIIGGNAVATWVASVDPSAVRFTPNVDVLIRRAELNLVRECIGSAGFVFDSTGTCDVFVGEPGERYRKAVRFWFAGELVKPDDLLPNPKLDEPTGESLPRVISLASLTQMKLTAFRDVDRTHLRDMIDVGLIDHSWPARFPRELGDRLQLLLDTPGG